MLINLSPADSAPECKSRIEALEKRKKNIYNVKRYACFLPPELQYLNLHFTLQQQLHDINLYFTLQLELQHLHLHFTLVHTQS